MNVQLTEQDIRNTLGFLISPSTSVRGDQTLTHAILVQTYQAFLQPNKDGTSEEEIPPPSEKQVEEATS